MLRHLKAIIFDSRVKDRWSVVLPLVKRVLDTTVHSATGQMPLQLTESIRAIVAASKQHQDKVVAAYLAQSQVVLPRSCIP